MLLRSMVLRRRIRHLNAAQGTFHLARLGHLVRDGLEAFVVPHAGKVVTMHQPAEPPTLVVKKRGDTLPVTEADSRTVSEHFLCHLSAAPLVLYMACLGFRTCCFLHPFGALKVLAHRCSCSPLRKHMRWSHPCA